MRVHYLQHVAFEGIGHIDSWLKGKKAHVTGTHFHQDQQPEFSVLENENIDLLIIMGGPMSVNDENVYPWLKTEKAFILKTIESGIPTLGICLGAQLIASALGSKVYPNLRKEIGWFPIKSAFLPENHNAGICSFPEMTTVFHWHGETFDLPTGSILLAESIACKHQAFQYGDRCIGLQFHLETTPESLEGMLEHCKDELADTKKSLWIQPSQQIREDAPTHFSTIHSLLESTLDFITRSPSIPGLR